MSTATDLIDCGAACLSGLPLGWGDALAAVYVVGLLLYCWFWLEPLEE